MDKNGNRVNNYCSSSYSTNSSSNYYSHRNMYVVQYHVNSSRNNNYNMYVLQ